MSDEIAHIDGLFMVDQTSNLHFEPEDLAGLRLSKPVRYGLMARFLALEEGECPCGSRLTLSTRRDRRLWKRSKMPIWDAYVIHFDDCPAVSPQTRQWIQNNRGLAR